MPASSTTKRKGAGDLTETEEPEAPAEEPVTVAPEEPEAPEEEPEEPPKGKPAANVNLLKRPAAKVKAKAKAKSQSAKAKAQTQSAPAGGKAKAKAKGSAKNTAEGERFEVYDQEVACSVLHYSTPSLSYSDSHTLFRRSQSFWRVLLQGYKHLWGQGGWPRSSSGSECVHFLLPCSSHHTRHRSPVLQVGGKYFDAEKAKEIAVRP